MRLQDIKRYIVRLYVLLQPNGYKKAMWLKRHKVFHYIGENVSYKTTLLPAEPFLVAIHDNVWLAAGVRLVTHSLTCDVFNNMDRTDMYKCQYGKIEIHSNVFVGAGAIIMYNVTIGSNVIIAPGAVVTKDVPSGSVVGGVPAKIIGNFEDSRLKAENFSLSINKSGGESKIAVKDLLAYHPVRQVLNRSAKI